MLNVMIVDDEPVTRFGIKASVDWAQEDMQVVGDYANGAAALERLAAGPVDILITDIKMPVMDGLALTRHALQQYPRIKVVLVSSHNDFAFVREGLKLGVVDYILKHSLEPEELISILRKCKELIREDERLGVRLREAGHEERMRLRKRYEQELKRYLVKPEAAIAEHAYPSWLKGPFQAACVKLNRVRDLNETYGYLYKSILLDQLSEAFYARVPEGIALTTAENGLFLLLPGEADAPLSLARLREELAGEAELGVTLGWVTGDGLSAVPACFRESMTACERGFFEGEGLYVYAGDRSRAHGEQRLPDRVKGLTAGDEAFERQLALWQAEWANGGISPSELKENACRVLSMRFKMTVDPYALVESFERLFQAESLAELAQLLKEQMSELSGLGSRTLDAAAASHPIDIALAYIRANYLDAMTLQQVADAVHVSKNYFSILFKKTTGQNFIDYVIDLRINQAKALLTHTDLRVYEVAERSGFNDVKYFSKLFKKIAGCAPVDYREGRKLNQAEPVDDREGRKPTPVEPAQGEGRE
ncbi:response regulator transcription factor [Cohnella nanjingensis]|uniref:Response regulator n=1 Tax=Cohnella nanjingensis TaxID=1387779 RepID=A0A7X0VET2_9BACL|nr:response regulator [Cohnella nanjingensis]MBB6671332.1 response regulator [Cohnella nanjingensis]